MSWHLRITDYWFLITWRFDKAVFKLGDGFWYGKNEKGVLNLSEMILLPGEGWKPEK